MAKEYPDPTDFVPDHRREEHFAERGKRGFSTEDWWNFDTYIAWVIANAVQKMKDDGNTMFSYPDEPDTKWEELTNAEYDIMIKGFGTWASGSWNMFDEEADQAVEDLKAALEIFSNRFMSLWD